MRKFWETFLLGALLVMMTVASVVAAPQKPDKLQGSKVTSLAHVEDNASANVTLVPAATGQSVTLYKYILSSSAADAFYLRCGSTQKTAKVYLGANGGLDATLLPLYIRCAAGEALTLVKGTAATPVGVTLWYMQEP